MTADDDTYDKNVMKIRKKMEIKGFYYMNFHLKWFRGRLHSLRRANAK